MGPAPAPPILHELDGAHGAAQRRLPADLGQLFNRSGSPPTSGGIAADHSPPLSYPLARRRTEQCHYSIQNPRGGSRELTSLGQDQLLVGRKQLAGASIALHS
jgi:hypothetical protein